MRDGGDELADRRQAFRAVQLVLDVDQLRVGSKKILRLEGQRSPRRCFPGLAFLPGHADIGDDPQDAHHDRPVDDRRDEPARLRGSQQADVRRDDAERDCQIHQFPVSDRRHQ